MALFVAAMVGGSGWPAEGLPYQELTELALIVIMMAMAGAYLLTTRAFAALELEQQKSETLRTAKEAAEAANLAKARYLANVSHEIRSPLNAIYGYAQLVEQEADVRPQDAARVIRRCAEHMTSLVEGLLDLTRVESGILRVRSEIVRLPDFIEQIMLMMRPAAQAKGLEFLHQTSGRVPEFVRTDSSRLRQALINLISNAIKFTDAGSVTFRMRYGGQIATFEIVDTGPGIAPEDHDRVFDPYERASNAAADARPGVGLGLPITKAIVEMLGGKLELQSEPGKGSCFRVTLMLSEVASGHAPEATTRRLAGYEGPRKTVLLVDDDLDQRAFLEHFLIGCGFDTHGVGDGESAVALCKSRTFDLAVLDINLPGMSGWEAADSIRKRLHEDGVIVMASANAQEFHRPEYHKPVHDHFFVKPYRLEELAEVIGALLKLRWKWEASGAPANAGAQAKGAMPAAALCHVTRLRELVSIGHMRGIEAEIGLLATAAPSHGQLINALYAALDEFDLAAMAKLLGDV